MTLDTKMSIRTDRSVAEVHDWINKNLLATPEIPEPALSDYGKEDGSIWNQGGQGLDAWLISKPAPVPLTWEEYIEDDEDYYNSLSGSELDDAKERFVASQAGGRHGSVLVSFDTAYGFRGENGEDCTTLHAMFLVALLKEFGEDAVAWQNEYTGEWAIGFDQDAIKKWLGNGDSAMSWFTNTVVPFIKEKGGSF